MGHAKNARHFAEDRDALLADAKRANEAGDQALKDRVVPVLSDYVDALTEQDVPAGLEWPDSRTVRFVVGSVHCKGLLTVRRYFGRLVFDFAVEGDTPPGVTLPEVEPVTEQAHTITRESTNKHVVRLLKLVNGTSLSIVQGPGKPQGPSMGSFRVG